MTLLVEEVVNRQMLTPNRLSTWKFNALSDFTRLRVVRLLAAEDGAMYAKELSAAMNVPSSHLSRHLQVLFASGLVRLERQGARVQIRLITESVEVAALATAVLARAADGDVFRQDLGRRIRED